MVTVTDGEPHHCCMEEGQACSCSEVTGVTEEDISPRVSCLAEVGEAL